MALLLWIFFISFVFMCIKSEIFKNVLFNSLFIFLQLYHFFSLKKEKESLTIKMQIQLL